jgi:hypothetical protein
MVRGRPRKGVTLQNLHQVDRYYYQALKDNRLFKETSVEATRELFRAKEAFQKLPSINWKTAATKKTSMSIRQAALQNWVDKYVPKEKWQRCLLTLRQHKSRKKLKLKRLDLQLDVYLTVKALANKLKLSLGEVIYKLAKPKLDQIYKKEWRKETSRIK